MDRCCSVFDQMFYLEYNVRYNKLSPSLSPPHPMNFPIPSPFPWIFPSTLCPCNFVTFPISIPIPAVHIHVVPYCCSVCYCSWSQTCGLNAVHFRSVMKCMCNVSCTGIVRSLSITLQLCVTFPQYYCHFIAVPTIS